VSLKKNTVRKSKSIWLEGQGNSLTMLGCEASQTLYKRLKSCLVTHLTTEAGRSISVVFSSRTDGSSF
jgi:hypothetical protein